ncbi:hypothetical protein D9M72_583970 [compost metagenome]
MWRSFLHDGTVAQQQDVVGCSKSFRLIVGNKNTADFQIKDQLTYPVTRFLTQLCIEIGKRFIHEKHTRFIDQCTTDSDALLLST